MKSDINIKRYLASLLDGTPPVGELTDFIHFTRNITEAYLLQFRSNVLTLCFNHGISVSDLAIDCIGDIFARDEKEEYYILKKFVDSLYHPLEDIPEHELFIAYKSFVIKLVNAQLARTYAQIDPVGARVHRNMKDAVKKSAGLTLYEDFRGYLIRTKNAGDEHIESQQLDELRRSLLEGSDVFHSMPKIIEKLAILLRKRYKKSVRLIDIVQIVKNYVAGYSMQEFIGNGIDNADDLTSVDMTILHKYILRDIQSKIFTTYVLSGKIDKQEAHALYSVMYDIVSDLCNGNASSDSYFTVARRHLPVSEKEYDIQWRAKIEYLARLAREKLMLYFNEKL